MQQSQAITRKSASNLALAFILLPRAKREGMSALYAFCREVDDVAALVLFLASDASSFITGTAIPIDGGMTAGFTTTAGWDPSNIDR